MPDVAVVTDTTHYLPRETVAELGVGEVSLYINDGERAEREADIVDLAAFYDTLRTADAFPTTSQPSIGDFLAVYEPLVRDGRDIVSIHISGGISGTVEAARQAAAELAASGARDRGGGQHHHPQRAAGEPRVDDLDARTGPGELGGRLARGLDRARDAAGDVDRDDVASVAHQGLVDGEEVADRGL